MRLVEADKQELGIELTEEEIQGVSKEVCKNFVKKKVKINYLKYLNNLKTKHSKSDSLVCTEVEMAEYISTPRMDTKKKELLFKLRSRTLDVKENFKNQQQNPWCISCGLFQETQGQL